MSNPIHPLQSLGEQLRERDYEFVTITPESHRCVNERRGTLQAESLRDVFGWNWRFRPELLPAPMFECLVQADALDTLEHGFVRSRVRYSRLNDGMYLHSAFPTSESDAVFFGPDTYRFAQLLRRWAPRAERAVDIGCGSGAGLLSIAERVNALVLADLNPRALLYTRINAALAGRAAEIVESDVLAAVGGKLDLIIANPPYMIDAAARVYRHGGAGQGTELSVRILEESLARLATGGTLIVYTGAPIVNGVDRFYQAIQRRLDAVHGDITYEELDPDVFGEELEKPAYAEVERIAVVGLRVCLSGEPGAAG